MKKQALIHYGGNAFSSIGALIGVSLLSHIVPADIYGTVALYIAIATLLFLTLREPPRGMSDVPSAAEDADSLDQPATAPETTLDAVEEKSPPMKEVLTYLWHKPSFRFMSLACGLHALVSYGVGTWNAPFLERLHDMTRTEIGGWIALMSAISAIGTFGGGYLTDKLFDRTGDRRWYLWLPAIATLAMVPFQFLAYLHPDFPWLYVGLNVAAILGGMYLGPSFALTQALVTLRMRAFASAILLLVLNLIGMGLGPFVIGVMADLFEPSQGIFALRYALCVTLVFNVIAAGCYFLGARTITEDIDATDALIRQRKAAVPMAS